jgi:diaminopimelate epimerase
LNTAPFFKYHALGNDYIVLDPAKFDLELTPERIRLICHRNFGIGSDGILFGPFFENEGIKLRILNPDGSEAEKSGNGIRIFARYLLDAGYVQGKRFSLKTLGGPVAVEFLDDTANLIRVDMGAATFQSEQIPVAGEPREVIREALEVGGRSFEVTCLSVGNPHCVIPLPDISEELAREFGPLIEKHPNFPNRINVQFIKTLNRKRIRIQIWERGAGYTLASGSSSCAAAAAAYRLGFVEPELEVEMPGGMIKIEIREDGHIIMTGSVTAVSQGEIAGDLWRQLLG